MMHLMGTPAKSQVKPKPRAKKGSRNIATVVGEATRAGNEEFSVFVATARLRSTN
jgi:hypothetical protein